jgi:hypothetical protein
LTGNIVGDGELYNTAAEFTRIMGHKSPDKFFKDRDRTPYVVSQARRF